MALQIGVLRVVLHIPSARSLKDGRAVMQRLRDRVRHRFEVSVQEVEASEIASRRVLAITTIGDDPRLIRSILDRIRALIEQDADAIAGQVDVDVFQWHPRDQWTPEGE
jgi:uncharacterized protein YlxP (DUF503 family)